MSDDRAPSLRIELPPGTTPAIEAMMRRLMAVWKPDAPLEPVVIGLPPGTRPELAQAIELALWALLPVLAPPGPSPLPVAARRPGRDH